MSISSVRAVRHFFIILCLIIVLCAAQQFDFPGTVLDDPIIFARQQMPEFAEQVSASYKESSRGRLPTLGAPVMSDIAAAVVGY